MQLGFNMGRSFSGTDLKIADGMFRVPSKQGVDNAVMRKATNPKTNEVKEVWEIPYQSLTCFIKDITKEDTEWGVKTIFTLTTNEDYKLRLNYDNYLAINLYKILPNVDATKPVTLSLTRTPDDKGELRTSIFVAQDGVNIKWKYTASNPQGMPANKKIKINGKEVTDKTEQLEFLWQESVIPFVANIPKDLIQNIKVDDIVQDFNVDDIPF